MVLYKRVILGRVSVREIYNLMNEFGDKLLEKNIRRYLGRNVVNDGIVETLMNDEKRQNFFFYNNGVTMICDQFSFNGLQEKDWIVRMEKLQIINGGQTCKTIYQTIKDHQDIDFSQVYLLIRLYEVSGDESVIQDITYATNSQNPVDFRDLKSNEPSQILLESSAESLGYTYKRKRDITLNTNVIPSTVAAEAVFAVWRAKPHLAKYKKNEFFDQYYNEIFNDLNAAQMIMAVLIFRFCDSCRKRHSDNPAVQAQRPYSQYFLSCMIGRQILKDLQLDINRLTHINFETVRKYYEENKEQMYKNAESKIILTLCRYFNTEEIYEIDGRSMAAVFRRFDILEQCLI